MTRCAGITRDGDRCNAGVRPGAQWCYNHDPDRAEERARHASRGGRARVNKEVKNLKAEVSEIIQRIDSGDVNRNDAAVMLQGYRVLKDLVELDRRVHETEELAREVEEMREALEQRKEDRWGA